MLSPIKTIENFKFFCALNREFQEIDWLRYATHSITNEVDSWTIKQGDACIELHAKNNEALLLLWLPGEPPPPMDNVKPQWDCTLMVQSILANCETFPQGVAWASNLQNKEWSSIWLATQWWPSEGQTDSVDNPAAWLRWWWTDVMEFTTELPSL
jgi:hypothetical protein